MRNFKRGKRSSKSGGLYLRAQTFLLAATMLTISGFAQAHAAGYSLNDELIYRINFGSSDDVKILLDKGANPNSLSTTGEYALTVAIGRNDAEAAPIVEALLEKGANPNVFDKANVYPLINATLNNETQVVAELLAKNADFHVKSANGRTLIEIAKSNNNPDIVKLIQDKLDQEARAAQALRSPERFKKIIRQYAFDSCAYQYWNFIVGSRQQPEKDQENQAKITAIRTEISDLIAQVQQYYPTTPSESLQHIADTSSKSIYSTLNDMVSNRNREKLGIGTQEDADTRCKALSDAVN
ncbi:MAG TPA: ankyrin repeat domain-containing protein [Rickettsiales bacterium]|nr:ankyrin repeat domain-containing protein [Rickettsiales bacterium]